MSTKRKIILFIIGAVVCIYLAVYTVLTPFIRGVVVDETTKQPVENAWVMATATIGTRTIAGDTGGTFLISRPHLRTGKDGVFYIFPKLYPSVPTPFTFGNMKKNVTVIVRVMDGKRAEVNLTGDWWKRVLFFKIPVKYILRTKEQLYTELSALSSYCVEGVRENGNLRSCDIWEIDYVIAQQEDLIKTIIDLSNIDQRVLYAASVYDLAKLYKRKGNLKKALQLLKTVKEFDLKRGIFWKLADYDKQINELESRLKHN